MLSRILFTRALTLATSTIRVSVLNTSSNFFVTALLGMVIFGELLPLMWWVGAAFLCAGSVIIGMREEKSVKEDQVMDEYKDEDASSMALGSGGAGGSAIMQAYRDHSGSVSSAGSSEDLESGEDWVRKREESTVF